MNLIIRGKFLIEGTEEVIFFEDSHFAEQVEIDGEVSIWATWGYEDSLISHAAYVVPIEGESSVEYH